MSRIDSCFRLVVALVLSAAAAFTASAEESKKSSWREMMIDPEDGKFDVSEYLENPRAFLAIPIIITEPAVGYGLGLTAVFLQPRHEAGSEGWKRPDISGLIGLKTENDTEGFGGFDLRYWQDGRIKSTAFGLSASVNLDFYAGSEAFRYNLDTKGGLIGGEIETGIENLSVAVNAHYFDIAASYEGRLTPNLVFDPLSENKFAGGAIKLIYDSRDNLFSPSRGIFLQTTLSANNEAVGATDNFHKLSQVMVGYWPVKDDWVVGAKVQADTINGDFPFYAKPFVSLRGVPAMRFQGETVAFTELEIQHVYTPRVRLLGFIGGGYTWDSTLGLDRNDSVLSGGVGVRYRIARKFGLDMGLDLAFSEEETTFYIQFGSAWLRM